MLENLSTKATVARIHAMHGNLLTKENYMDLLNKQSVSEIAAYLKKNTRYKDILSSIDTNTVHRGLLESLIRRCNFDVYEKICKFQQLDKTPFYNYELMLEEIEQILNCILHLNSDSSEEYISSLPSYLIEHASFDMIALAKSKNFEDLLKVLKNTSYWLSLKTVTPDEDGQVNYLQCEVLLRTAFYKKIFEFIDKDFSGKAASSLKDSLKTQIDLINFTNAYRLKAYFNADSETIKRNMLPFFGKLGQKRMLDFYELKDKEEMLEFFKDTKYARKISEINADIVEKNIYQISYLSARTSLQNAQTAPVALYNFLILCETEAQNLISIIEGNRYKASSGYIEKLLLM